MRIKSEQINQSSTHPALLSLSPLLPFFIFSFRAKKPIKRPIMQGDFQQCPWLIEQPNYKVFFLFTSNVAQRQSAQPTVADKNRIVSIVIPEHCVTWAPEIPVNIKLDKYLTKSPFAHNTLDKRSPLLCSSTHIDINLSLSLSHSCIIRGIVNMCCMCHSPATCSNNVQRSQQILSIKQINIQIISLR